MMTTHSNSRKRHRLPLGLGRILIIYLPFAILELIIVFFVGIGYFCLLFWLFQLVFTVALCRPELYRLLLGAGLYEKNRDKLLRLVSSKWYRVNLLVTNIFYPIIVVLLFKYNFRLVDLLSR